jgi:hypothetical protein
MVELLLSPEKCREFLAFSSWKLPGVYSFYIYSFKFLETGVAPLSQEFCYS